MARQMPGEQVEHAFNPKRLNMWEVPVEDQKLTTTSIGTRFGTMQPRSGKTGFIVDDKGYLLPGVAKLNNSFNHPSTTPVYMRSPARWPAVNPAIPRTGRSTMGYKGIPTAYLPTNTVTIKAVDINGCRETNFNFN